jgi:hypothetical protein
MGHSLQIIAGVEVGDSLLGVQGTDAGVVVAKATGPLLAATLGIETP